VTQAPRNQILHDIHAQMDEHAKVPATTTLEWAMWYEKLGSLWGMFAANTGEGHGSACSAYSRAAEKYRELGSDNGAADCRDLARKYANLADMKGKQ